MELQKLGHPTHTHAEPATATHKPAPHATDDKSTLAPAAEHDDAQPGCFECLKPCWDSFVKLMQDFWAGLFDFSESSVSDEDGSAVKAVAAPAQKTAPATTPTAAAAQTEGVSQEEILSMVASIVKDAWKDKINRLPFPCVAVGKMLLYIGGEQPVFKTCVMQLTVQDWMDNTHTRVLGEWHKAMEAIVRSHVSQLQRGNIVFTFDSFSHGPDSKVRVNSTVHQVIPSQKERALSQRSHTQQLLDAAGVQEIVCNKCPEHDILAMLKAHEILKTESH